MSNHGRLTLESLADAALHGTIETVLIVIPDFYGRLLGKRTPVDYFLATLPKVAGTSATMSSPVTWKWIQYRAMTSQTGSAATVISMQ